MTSVATRVLIINKDIRFNVDIKRGLETQGDYEVSPFTSVETALDFLQQRPHDVVLVDFALPDATGAEIVMRLKSLQPDIAVIATPDTEDVRAAASQMQLGGVVSVPITARDLEPILEQAMQQSHDSLPETTEAPAADDDADTLVLDRKSKRPLPPTPGDIIMRVLDSKSDDDEDSQTIEFVLTGELSALKERLAQQPDRKSADEADEAIGLFQKLAAEEPPMPPPEESGTVSDIMTGISATNVRKIAEYLKQEQPEEPELDMEDSTAPTMPEPTPASLILQDALDETRPFSFEELVSSLETQFPVNRAGIRPLPSWARDEERYIREPDFLRETMPAEDAGGEDDYGETRDVSPAQQLDLPQDDSEEDSQPTPAFFEGLAAPLQDEPEEEAEIEEDRPVAELPPYEFDTPNTAAEADPAPPPPPGTLPEQVTLGTQSEDPEIAQLALNLVQMSMEMITEALVLTRDNEIAAYSGTLPLEDIDDVSDLIQGDWDAGSDETRIRFIMLPSNNERHAIISRRTEGDFTLSMIFSGELHTGVLRRQSDRLLNALETMQEDEETENRTLIDELREIEELEAQADSESESAMQTSAEVQAIQQEMLTAQAEKADQDDDDADDIPYDDTPEDSELLEPVEMEGPRTPYTYLWLTRDPDQPLDNRVRGAIRQRLPQRLTKLGWEVRDINVDEDYIYLLANIPGESLAHEIIRDLKRRSARIARKADPDVDPDALWADSYCVLTPGRELEQNEIQDFINFTRM